MAELRNESDGRRSRAWTALRCLNADHADRRPCLFLLAIGAALLSTLALRDALLGAPLVALELSGAVGLWALLLAATGWLARHER